MILFTIIGALVGAGFASGQEIYLFFYRFGKNGIFGIALCSLIFGLIIYKSLKIIKDNEINTYNDFLNVIFANKVFFNKITNLIINVFLCVTFFIMISGFGAYFYQEFRIK